MQRLTMLVTPEAEWLRPDSPEFLAALGDPEPDYDAAAFAVKNLGFIKFQIIEHSIIEIELHPRNVELTALLSVQQQLLTSTIKLFRIKYLDNEWRSEILCSAEHAIGRLSELCSRVPPLSADDRYVVQPKDLSELFADDANWLRPLAVKWRMSFGQFDTSVISLAVNHGLLSRLMIAGIRPGKSEPAWRFIGDGHQWVGRTYHLCGIGERVQNMPDKDYGEWINHFYKSVAVTHQPRYDLITGAVQYQDELGKPTRVRRYLRLMLPWKTPSEEVLVTMCSSPVDEAA